MTTVWIYGWIKLGSIHISRYEFTLASGFGLWPMLVLRTTLQTFYHANIDYLRNWQTFIIVSGFVVMFYCTASAGFNYLWINLGFFPPIPFGAYTIGSITYPLMCAILWFRIQKNARKTKELKTRFVIFLVSQVFSVFVAWVYAFTTSVFILIPSYYQPILGFVSPLYRAIILKILNFLTYRADGGRHVKMGNYFLNTASGSGSNIPYFCE